MVELYYPSDDDVVYLAEHMRKEDAAEVWAGEGATPLESLRRGVRVSRECRCLKIDGEVLGICGVMPLPSISTEVAVVWALTGTAVDRHPKTFYRYSREILELYRGMYPVLVNLVDGRYDRARRWLKRLGFVEGEPTILEPLGIPFFPVHIRR